MCGDRPLESACTGDPERVTPSEPAPLPEPLRGAVFTTADARRHGVSPDRMRAADLDRRVYGVRAESGRAESLAGRCRMFASRLGDGFFFSHSTAARLLGAPLPLRLERLDRVHVTVAAPTRAPHAHGLIGHSRVVAPGDFVWLDDSLQVSAPARLLAEMASILALPDLVAVADHLIHHRRPLCSCADLAARLEFDDRLSRSAKLRAAIALADERAESRPESVLRVILTLGGIQPEAVNHEVRVGDARFRLDLAYPSRRVAIEYQGDHHRDPAQWRRDLTRRAELEMAGWTVLDFHADDLASPQRCVARVRAALAR